MDLSLKCTIFKITNMEHIIKIRCGLFMALCILGSFSVLLSQTTLIPYGMWAGCGSARCQVWARYGPREFCYLDDEYERVTAWWVAAACLSLSGYKKRMHCHKPWLTDSPEPWFSRAGLHDHCQLCPLTFAPNEQQNISTSPSWWWLNFLDRTGNLANN